MVRQSVDSRYVDFEVLRSLLERKFPEGSFTIKIKNDVIILEIPQELTDTELEKMPDRSMPGGPVTFRDESGIPFFDQRILKERDRDKTIYVVKTNLQRQNDLIPGLPHEAKIALKRYSPRIEKLFSREARMLRTVQRLNHRYIISLIASYQNDDGLFIALPLGQCNLFEFWMHTDPTSDLQGYGTWFANQAAGLVDALSMMHQLSRLDEEYRYSCATSHTSRPIGVLHGDIKPTNFLIFSNGEMAKPTIKFIDFEMSLWDDEVPHNFPIHTYEAPEIRMDRIMSKKSDIWSLGCVFLEFTIWMIGGAGAVTNAGERRLMRTPGSNTTWLEDDRFFMLEYQAGNPVGAKVKDIVVECMQSMLQEEQCTSITQQILAAIITDMLIVRPDLRKSAEELATTLENVLGNDS